MPGVSYIGGIELNPVAYRDGAIVRVDNNHALVAYLTDLYPTFGSRVVLALIDANGAQVDTWISPEINGGQYWTGGSVTGLYRMADGKILMLRSDSILDAPVSSYDLKAYELDFSESTGIIPEPVIYTLAHEEDPGAGSAAKWWAGGVGSGDGVVIFRISSDYTTYDMYWYEAFAGGSLSSVLESFTVDPGEYLAAWASLGGGKALFLHPKIGTGLSIYSAVDVVTASASDISRVLVADHPSNWIYGPGTPKEPGQSTFVPYGEQGFILLDVDYFVTELFANNSTNDYDSGLWNNIGDGYNGVTQFGNQFVLVQTTTFTIDFYFEDGSIVSVGQTPEELIPTGTGKLIGTASGYSTLWVTDKNGRVNTFRISLPPATAAPGPGRIRFAGGGS